MAIVQRDLERLKAVTPPLRDLTTKLLDAMDRLDYPMTVTAGVRTMAAQQALYAQGRTAPGNIVTNADGVTKKSNHQPKDDGFGYAVDCAFLVDGADRDGELETPSWGEDHPWFLYGQMAKTLGKGKVVWGGDWSGLRDLPHIEWKG
jgi:peptidoglycan L-alanyl-D-glutamate endopeptidase CwlK